MGSVPNLMDWEDDTQPTSTQFNNNIRTPINFFVKPPGVVVRNQPQTQSIAWNTWTQLQWSTDDGRDEDGFYPGSGGNAANQIRPQTMGYYEVKAEVRWMLHRPSLGFPPVDDVPTGGRSVLIYRNTTSGTFEVASDRRRTSDHYTAEGVACQSAIGYAFMNGTTDYFTVSVWHDQKNPSFNGPGDPESSAIWNEPPTDADFTGLWTVRFSAVWIGMGQ